MTDIPNAIPRAAAASDAPAAAGQLRGRVAAIATALVFTVGFGGLLFTGPPGGGTTTAKMLTDYYHSGGSVLLGMILGFVQVAGCLLLIWHFSELRARLADTMLTRVGHTFAIVGAAMVLAGTGIMLGPSGVQLFTGANFGGGSFVGVPAAITAAQSGLWVLLFGGVYPLGAAIFLMSLAALRQRAGLPSWLAVAGMVIAVLLLGALIGTPALLLVFWLLLIAATGFRAASGA